MSFLSAIIGKKLTPEEQVKKWKQSLKAQERELEKTIRGIETEEIKTKRLIKAAAKRNDMDSCKVLSKEILRARKVKDRLYTSKAQLNSLGLAMQQQMATLKVAGCLEKSSQVMGLVNKLVKLPEISHAMMELSKEMTKAGIIDEMMQDTIEMSDEADLEEAADLEVEKVLFEMTDGLLGQAGTVGAELNMPQESEKQDALKSRMNALKSI